MKTLFKVGDLVLNNSTMWHGGGNNICDNKGEIGQEGKIIKICGEFTAYLSSGEKEVVVYIIEWLDGSGKCGKGEYQLRGHHSFYKELRENKIKKILNEPK